MNSLTTLKPNIIIKGKQSNDMHTYQQNYNKDIRLPSLEYINDGFYQDLNEKFNIDTLMQGIKEEDY